MPQTLDSITRGPQRLLPLACFLVPLLALALVGGWRYLQHWNEAEVRLDRILRVAAEHARGVLDTSEGLIERVSDLTTAAGDTQQITERQAQLHAQLAAIAGNKPQLQGIFVFGPDGLPKVASRFFPAPKVSVADRDYFRWHAEGRGGLYISQPLVARTTGEAFFDMSRERREPDGRFGGVISASLLSGYFNDFYTDLLADEPGMSVMLFREDGYVFNRTPAAGSVQRLPPDGLVMPQITKGVTVGWARGSSVIDTEDRTVVFRRVGSYPVYVSAAVVSSAVMNRWLWEVGVLALFGLPAAAALSFAVRGVMRRSAAVAQQAVQLRESLRLQQEMQAALLQSQKLEALGRVTGGVAHDFNNALMVISNSLALLRLKNPGVQGSYLGAMDRALNAATQLTRQLLAFSRRQALVPEQVVLQKHLPGMADLLRPVLGSRIALRIEVSPNTSPICVDPAEFELALINLAINARDAMPQEGRFSLRVRNVSWDLPSGMPGPMVVVEAEDTGAGMPPEIVEKVFEPFFTTKAPGEGTGLGLSQVYGLCQRAGGTATITSQLGQGTTVRMYFPPDRLQGRPAPSGERAPPARKAQRKLLLVEDNREVAAVLVPLLESTGCHVTHAERGALALDWLKSQPQLPDALLTDVVMPGEIDGLALAREVRKRWPEMTVVVMTGYTQQLDQIAAEGLRVVPKPCTVEMLVRALDEAGTETAA